MKRGILHIGISTGKGLEGCSQMSIKAAESIMSEFTRGFYSLSFGHFAVSDEVPDMRYRPWGCIISGVVDNYDEKRLLLRDLGYTIVVPKRSW